MRALTTKGLICSSDHMVLERALYALKQGLIKAAFHEAWVERSGISQPGVLRRQQTRGAPPPPPPPPLARARGRNPLGDAFLRRMITTRGSEAKLITTHTFGQAETRRAAPRFSPARLPARGQNRWAEQAQLLRGREFLLLTPLPFCAHAPKAVALKSPS